MDNSTSTGSFTKERSKTMPTGSEGQSKHSYSRKPSIKDLKQLSYEFPKVYLDGRHGRPEVKGEMSDLYENSMLVDEALKKSRRYKFSGVDEKGKTNQPTDTGSRPQSMNIRDLYPIRAKEKPKSASRRKRTSVRLSQKSSASASVASEDGEPMARAQRSDDEETGYDQKVFSSETSSSSTDDEFDRSGKTSRIYRPYFVRLQQTWSQDMKEVAGQSANYVLVNISETNGRPKPALRYSHAKGDASQVTSEDGAHRSAGRQMALRVVLGSDGKTEYYVDESDTNSVKVYQLNDDKHKLERVPTKVVMKALHGSVDLKKLSDDLPADSEELILKLEPVQSTTTKRKRRKKPKAAKKPQEMQKKASSSKTVRPSLNEAKVDVTRGSIALSTSEDLGRYDTLLSLELLRKANAVGSIGGATARSIISRTVVSGESHDNDCSLDATLGDDFNRTVQIQDQVTTGQSSATLTRLEQITGEKKLKQLEPPMFFLDPPEPQPLAMCFEYPGSELTHRDVLKAVLTPLHFIPKARVDRMQFIPRTVLLGVVWVKNRWVLQLSTPQCISVLNMHGININGENIRLRKLDDVLREDYDKFLNNKEKFSKKTRNRHRNQTTSDANLPLRLLPGGTIGDVLREEENTSSAEDYGPNRTTGQTLVF